MNITQLSIKGASLIDSPSHLDSRGEFREVFRKSSLQSVLGVDFEVKQFNRSVSHAGVIRGIHWTSGSLGQKKYITCTFGSILDVVVDIRTGSRTFGHWHSQILTPSSGKAIYIDSDLGHAFLSLEDNSIVEYLCSEEYSPSDQMVINPFDSTVAIDYKSFFPGPFEISKKDADAPSLEWAMRNGMLPNLEKKDSSSS